MTRRGVTWVLMGDTGRWVDHDRFSCSSTLERDLVSAILETNLTIQGNRQNAIVKKVTSWAGIIAVPAAVTGYYGMNVPYPGFGRPSGTVTSTLLLVVLSSALYLLFKRLDWL